MCVCVYVYVYIPRITQIDYQEKQLNTNPEISNAFNDFFTKIGPNLDNEIPKLRGYKTPSYYLKNKVPNSFLISATNQYEIIDIIKNLDDSKSPGPSSIPTKLIKIAGDTIATQLSDICNISFSQGIFPDANKIAKIIPIHKKGSTKDVNNYSPISLLTTFSKIFEKLMAKRHNNLLDEHTIIHPKQYGIRSEHSTTHQKKRITEKFRKPLMRRNTGVESS